MSGMTEILLIIAIALAIFLLPRLAGKTQERTGGPNQTSGQMSGWVRLAILASLLWVALVAVYLRPWSHPVTAWQEFAYVAIGPVGVFWGVFWVFSGFRKEKNK
ncbi:MAG: hypothetical protein R6U38_11415 [Desulfatiglandaceae bacterium]